MCTLPNSNGIPLPDSVTSYNSVWLLPEVFALIEIQYLQTFGRDLKNCTLKFSYLMIAAQSLYFIFTTGYN